MSLPTERYALLIRQLGSELGYVRGWKRRVADLLGVHPSYVSRILSGEKLKIGPEVIDRACERLALDSRFFFKELDGDPSYRDFLQGAEDAAQKGRAEADEDRSAWLAAGDAAMNFLRVASASRGARDSVAAEAVSVLRAAREIPIVQHILALEDATARGDRDDAIEAGWRLAAALVVERARRE